MKKGEPPSPDWGIKFKLVYEELKPRRKIHEHRKSNRISNISSFGRMAFRTFILEEKL